MKAFRIETQDWIDEVEVDETVWDTYESQAQEAISLSLERWLQSDNECAIGPLTLAYDIETGLKPDTAFLMNNKFVFENIGRPDMAELFDEVTDE